MCPFTESCFNCGDKTICRRWQDYKAQTPILQVKRLKTPITNRLLKKVAMRKILNAITEVMAIDLRKECNKYEGPPMRN